MKPKIFMAQVLGSEDAATGRPTRYHLPAAAPVAADIGTGTERPGPCRQRRWRLARRRI
jgi:hypothetical protein